MYKYFYYLLFLTATPAIGQRTSTSNWNKIVIDSAFYDELFNFAYSPNLMAGATGTAILKNTTTGKVDTFQTEPSKNEIRNCKLVDSGQHHYGFDNCIAFTFAGNDTMILQFQNNNSEEPRFAWWDKLIVHVFQDKFYATYIFTNISPYKLEVYKQTLILKRLTTRKGEHLRGELILSCLNRNPDQDGPKTVRFKGPFDVIIQ
jgi:hypothetical protein